MPTKAARVLALVATLTAAVYVSSSFGGGIKRESFPSTHFSHRGSDSAVRYVVIHSCSDALRNPQAPYQLDNIIRFFLQAGVSAHYVIDRGGTTYSLVDERNAAFHAGRGALPWDESVTDRMNQCSIGIELLGIGTSRDMAIFMGPAAYGRINREHIGFTDAQYRTLRILLKGISSRWPGISLTKRQVIGHNEYAQTRRTDPGELFDWAKAGISH